MSVKRHKFPDKTLPPKKNVRETPQNPGQNLVGGGFVHEWGNFFLCADLCNFTFTMIDCTMEELLQCNTPQVMGILNINNESFFQGSRHTALEEVDAAFGNMVAQGADIIDIGACSTRPGSTPIPLEQEWDYLKGALKLIKEKYVEGEGLWGKGVIEDALKGKGLEGEGLWEKEVPGGALSGRGQKGKVLEEKGLEGEELLGRKLSGRKIRISLDTFRSEIVRRAYDVLGEFIVNDISAGEDDPLMLSTVGELELPYIAMHKRGTPSTMQQMCHYPNGVTNEVAEYFKKFEERAAKFGIKEYIMDPGFGFAKNLEQNYELFNGIPQLISQIEEFAGKKRQLLVGISRKGMIWKPLGITPNEALCGTVALNLQALLLGADIIRVHDVTQARECVKLWKLLTKK